jgi:hypothetical protein
VRYHNAESHIEDDDLPENKVFKGEWKGQMPPTVVEFSTTDDMLDFLAKTKPKWKADKLASHMTEWTDHEGKSGVRDWKAALDLARRGWAEGRRLLMHAEGQGLNTGIAKARKWNFDTAGAIPDVPRYIAGNPDHMMDFLPSNHGRKPIISICVSPMCPATVTPQKRANWGAALLSWVEAEEVLGNRVDINVIYVTTTTWGREGTRFGNIVSKFGLKNDVMHRSVDDMAFWLMHNAAHQRVQFAIRECLDVAAAYKSHPAYGIAVMEHEKIRPHLPSNEILLVLGQGADSVSEGLELIYADIERHRSALKGE